MAIGDDADLVRRALKAHDRTRKHRLAPASYAACVRPRNGKTYVILRDDSGLTLAVYRLIRSGDLRGLRVWPDEVEDADRAARKRTAGVSVSTSISKVVTPAP
jgi:hypothetical protein